MKRHILFLRTAKAMARQVCKHITSCAILALLGTGLYAAFNGVRLLLALAEDAPVVLTAWDKVHIGVFVTLVILVLALWVIVVASHILDEEERLRWIQENVKGKTKD